MFETGVTPVPFVRSGPLAPVAPGSSQMSRSLSSTSVPAGAQFGGSNAWPAGGKGSGQALPIYPLPAVLGGAGRHDLPDPDLNDWFTHWMKPLMQNYYCATIWMRTARQS